MPAISRRTLSAPADDAPATYVGMATCKARTGISRERLISLVFGGAIRVLVVAGSPPKVALEDAIRIAEAEGIKPRRSA